MNNTKRKLAILLTLSTLMTSLVGCGSISSGSGNSDLEQVVDKTKTQITFNVFNGGYGYAWAVNAAKEWNETNDKYQVIVTPSKDEWYVFESNFQAGTCQYDIILNVPSESAYAQGYIEDLSDILNSQAKGETVALKDKVLTQDDIDYFTYNNATFALPFFVGWSGFVYDHDIFKSKGFLIGQDGELITSPNATLSVGRDGKPGTYDDGQPVNMTQYNKMVSAIKASGMYTYLWSGKFSYYTEPLFWSLFYDYIGKENTDIFNNLSGTYKNPKTGESILISKDNGYEVYGMEGYQQSLQFIYDYLGDPLYYHPQSAKPSTSHTDAQKVFVYGNAFDGQTADKQAAFLYEGVWWENESRANFNSLSGRGYADYEFGVRDYRMMVPPMLDENGVYDKIPLVAFDTLAVTVKKQKDADQLAAIKDFLSYLYTNEVLRDVAVSTGGQIPIDCDLTNEDFNSMTKFARNMNQMMLDENTYTFSLKYPPKNRSGRGGTVANLSHTTATSLPITFFLRGPGLTTICNAADGYAGIKSYYEKEWATFAVNYK